MANLITNVENNFTAGLKTEYTGLNFPENACTDVDNCTFGLTGEVSRRLGIDYEDNFTFFSANRQNKAMSSYKWKNAGGIGTVEILVRQIGFMIYYYRYSDTTTSTSISSTKLSTETNLMTYRVGSNSVEDIECQYADGNGYLFIFHPGCNPIYLTYNPDTGVINSFPIEIKIRDFLGVPEPGVLPQTRPLTLSAQHKYNLTNQGWTSGSAWSAQDTTNTQSIPASTPASRTFTVASGIAGISPGQSVRIDATNPSSGLFIANAMLGSVTSYAGTSLTINVTYASTYLGGSLAGGVFEVYDIYQVSGGYIDTWFTAAGNYPSNSDVWWRFKNSSGAFDPATMIDKVTVNSGPAPRGHFILSAFDQERSAAAGFAGITGIFTNARPKTGAWFQGRVWYAGADDSNPPLGTAPFYTWTENIYFSQVIEGQEQFPMCYQNNDPTSEDAFDLLPTDGGVITIQGCGTIYKLFPVQNGLLVFAANGIWFITGSQGIGFSANDYTITKVSEIRCLSGASFVNVLGWPMFWNVEGIYQVGLSPQGGGIVVNNLCDGTILSFYRDIPTISKIYARGDYNPTDFVIKWVFRDTAETSITSRYEYNRVLNFNTANKAFYPYSREEGGTNTKIHDVKYINVISSASSPEPTDKYLISDGLVTNASILFAEEKDDIHWTDFYSAAQPGVNYISYFVTGYKLHGKGIAKFQPVYLRMFSQADVPTAYKIQGIWDYANNPNSGRYSAIQLISNAINRQGILYRRHKIRGSGLALQLKVISQDGKPFNIIGWSSLETQNMSM